MTWSCEDSVEKSAFNAIFVDVMREMSSWGEFHLLTTKNNGENPRRGIQVSYMLMEQRTDMGRRNKCRTGRKRPWSRATLSTDVAAYFRVTVLLFSLGFNVIVSACADVRVRMTSGMPSVFVSEATGGANGVAGGGEQW